MTLTPELLDEGLKLHEVCEADSDNILKCEAYATWCINYVPTLIVALKEARGRIADLEEYAPECDMCKKLSIDCECP